MDPLSIIASTIAVATPITICLRRLRQNRHAKVALRLLVDEVDEVVFLLQDIEHSLRLQNHMRSIRSNPRLLQILLALKTKITDLSLEVTEWNSQNSEQASAKRRVLIWTVIASKVKLFKDDLERIRSQLVTVLSMLNLYVGYGLASLQQ